MTEKVRLENFFLWTFVRQRTAAAALIGERKHLSLVWHKRSQIRKVIETPNLNGLSLLRVKKVIRRYPGKRGNIQEKETKQKMNSYDRLVPLTSCAKIHKFITNVTDKKKPYTVYQIF